MIVDREIRDAPSSSILFSILNDVFSNPIEGRVFVAIFSSLLRLFSTKTLEAADFAPEPDSELEDAVPELDSELGLEPGLELDSELDFPLSPLLVSSFPLPISRLLLQSPSSPSRDRSERL